MFCGFACAALHLSSLGISQRLLWLLPSLCTSAWVSHLPLSWLVIGQSSLIINPWEQHLFAVGRKTSPSTYDFPVEVKCVGHTWSILSFVVLTWGTTPWLCMHRPPEISENKDGVSDGCMSTSSVHILWAQYREGAKCWASRSLQMFIWTLSPGAA